MFLSLLPLPPSLSLSQSLSWLHSSSPAAPLEEHDDAASGVWHVEQRWAPLRGQPGQGQAVSLGLHLSHTKTTNIRSGNQEEEPLQINTYPRMLLLFRAFFGVCSCAINSIDLYKFNAYVYIIHDTGNIRTYTMLYWCFCAHAQWYYLFKRI